MSGTASPNVFIVDESFYFPSLKRTRRIWVYRPVGYDSSTDLYPVIYMHDGQNLFDEVNAFGSEWSVDETLDAEQGKVIVVGIDNGMEHRMSEYMFYDHPEHGAAEGRAYLNDIAFVLKPFIDGLLRTRKENHFTCIAGSSMGGLISFYAGLYLPEVFGAVGVLSPALWLDAPRIFNETQSLLLTDSRRNDPGLRQRWYFYAGALETETLISEVATMVMIMRQSPHIEVTYQLDSGGIHDEIVWNHYFPNLYKWFTGLKPAEVVEGESHIRIP